MWTLPYLTVQRLLPVLRGTLASGLADAGLMRAARRQGMVSWRVALCSARKGASLSRNHSAWRQGKPSHEMERLRIVMNARSMDVFFDWAGADFFKAGSVAPTREPYPAYHIAGFSDKVSSAGA